MSSNLICQVISLNEKKKKKKKNNNNNNNNKNNSICRGKFIDKY